MFMHVADRTNAIKIASWSMAVVMLMIFTARQTTKAVLFRRVAVDDILILLAFLLSIGLSVITFILASNGLGSSASLTGSQADVVSKGHYACDLLYISAICFPKLSILVFFYNVVAGQRFVRNAVLAFGVFILAWTLASLVAVAMQCDLPYPWTGMPSHCFQARIFWVAYCVLDMTTEIAIIVMSLCLVVFNKLRMYRKVLVASCFAPRLLVAVAALARLIWMYPVTPRYDRQHELWVPTVISQIQLCLSIATASIPFMVPYFGGFSGNLRRVASAKSTMHLLNEEDARSKSSLWFRRHQKVDAIDLWDLTAGSAVQYERVPKASPRIPSTRPITPLSPPRVQESPKDQARLHGLNIYIPCRDPRRKQSLDLASPRTQSSGVLSPSCTSPHAYLLSSFIPSRKAPTPPVKAYSPRPPTPSSCYSSRSPTPVSPAPDRQRLSLFPSQRLRVVSPRVQYTTSQSPNSKPIRKMRTAVDYSNAMSVAQPGPGGLPARGKFSTRSPRRAQPPKFSIATQLQIPQLSKLDENKTRPRSAQDLTSPMGAAINNWFSSENTQPLPASPSSPSSSSQHLFDQNASSSIGMPRMPVSPSVSHSRLRTRLDVLLEEPSPPHDPPFLSRPSRSSSIPPVRDVRNSPRIVVRNIL